MGLFDNPEERARKANLKKLEDKRVAFAEQLAKEGFTPEKMLFAQTMNGGFVALCHFRGQYCLVVSPGFGTDEPFVLERYDTLKYTMQPVHVKSEGMAGIFGFGKKGEEGADFIITRTDGSEAHMPFVAGRNGWMEFKLAKNPLLRTQRRRGDANLVWEFKPLDRSTVAHAIDVARTYFPEA